MGIATLPPLAAVLAEVGGLPPYSRWLQEHREQLAPYLADFSHANIYLVYLQAQVFHRGALSPQAIRWAPVMLSYYPASETLGYCESHSPMRFSSTGDRCPAPPWCGGSSLPTRSLAQILQAYAPVAA